MVIQSIRSLVETRPTAVKLGGNVHQYVRKDVLCQCLQSLRWGPGLDPSLAAHRQSDCICDILPRMRMRWLGINMLQMVGVALMAGVRCERALPGARRAADWWF
jgi:hypothetical protein